MIASAHRGSHERQHTAREWEVGNIVARPVVG
jgi:hypothetical protein